jgi:DNA-binding LacI/PurR family transcriptional regulator
VRANGRTTIFEVAEAAGVSITTVSHVFSGKRRVNEETRRRVHEAAERLAYRPRLTARALATGRTMTLALQLSTSIDQLALNPFFSELLPAVSLAGIERGYTFVFVPRRPPPGTAFDALVGESRVDGAVLIDPVDDDAFVQALRERGVPFVSLGHLLDPPNEHWVDNDHHAICAGMLEHLREAGYTRPAYLTPPSSPESLQAEYLASFDRHAPGAPVRWATDYTASAGCLAAKELLALDPRPDSLLVADHRLAFGALRGASELGLSVPDDVGVATVGGSSVAALARPPLTAVDLNAALAGRLLVETLDALLQG